ncbi:MAG: hypothetical protein ABFS38_15650 [Bacteroidota bacterium]
MIAKKLLPAMAVLLFVAGVAFGQSKKSIREKGIVSITVDEYFIEEGMDEPVVESIENFNEQGELVEIREFDKRGDLEKWEKYVYNEDGELVEAIFLDEKGRITETEKNIYDGKLRIEKQYYNNKGNLYKKKVYKYEYR